MLQIFIHGTQQSGFLDLTPGSVLDFESLQESFDEDITTGEYSLPIDIPWTDNNRRLLSFTERLENFHNSDNVWICTVYDKMFPELIRVKFSVLGKKGNLNYRNGSFSASISGSKGLYGMAIKNKKLADLALGGPISWNGMNSRQYAHSHATGGQPNYPYIVFTPVAIEKYFNEDRKDYSGEFLAGDTVNTVIITGPGENDWIFGRPSPGNPSVAVEAGADGYQDYRTVPFFRVQYVLQQCFQQFGFQVSGDLVDDPAFANLVLFNNYALEIYPANTFNDTNRKITPLNHVPDAYIGDWLKALFQLTSLFPVFGDNSQVQLVYHKTDLTLKQITSLDESLTGDFESQYVDTTTDQGYKIAYTWDSNDQYYSERVKDLTDKTLVATVATRADLDALNIGRPFTTDDIALVEAENMHYQVADGTVVPVTWDAFSENLGEYISGAAATNVDIACSTLCTYVVQNPTTLLYNRCNYVGCRQLGTYINNAGALVKNPFGIRVFYASKRLSGTVNIPVSYNHNRDAANNVILPYTLAITGPGGLALTFHAPWLDIIQNAELVTVTAAGNQKLLRKLRSYNRFQIAGTLFLLKQIQRSIPAAATVKLQMVAL